MKSLVLILTLCASPAAWANGSQSDAPAKSLNELIAFFSSSPLSGLQAAPADARAPRARTPNGKPPVRREVGRKFMMAKGTGRGISIQPLHQQMNAGRFGR